MSFLALGLTWVLLPESLPKEDRQISGKNFFSRKFASGGKHSPARLESC
jgi:hypothetical protein